MSAGTVRRPRPGEFDYLNQTYGLNLHKHAPVVHSDGRRGQVTKADGCYIFIQWDGAAKPQGPYHPTSELSYPEVKS